MFRFAEISLHGWSVWSQVRVPLDRNVILVTGPNGSGKTTLLDAIRQLLNAPKLSSRRRLQHYLRRPDVPALIRAVVSNTTPEGGAPPFQHERIVSPEATLACALVPASGGSPEKRFAILPGRVSTEELRKLLLESRNFYAPDRYTRALERAGVTRSLMGILAIEQGRMNSLFDLKPRELFRHVLDMLGDQTVLERYGQARLRYEQTRLEVSRQMSGLQSLQVQLGEVKRRVQTREEWEQAHDKVDELKTRFPAAQLQALFRSRQEAALKITELRTKVRNGKAEQARLEKEASRALESEGSARRAEEAAQSRQSASEVTWGKAERESAITAERVHRFESLEREAAAMPKGDLKTLEKTVEQVRETDFAARRTFQDAEARARDATDTVNQLRNGLPVYPEPVRITLQALEVRNIRAKLLVATVDSVDVQLAQATEAYLGDARYALLVSSRDIAKTIEISRDHDFPGPVYDGVCVKEKASVGPLRLGPGAPAWLRQQLEGVRLNPDGTWADIRGIWVARPRGRVLGAQGIMAALSDAEAELTDAQTALAAAKKTTEEVSERRKGAEVALESEQRRQMLLAELQALPSARVEAAKAKATSEDAKRILTQAKTALAEAMTTFHTAERAREQAERDLHELGQRLRGETQALEESERSVSECDTKIRELEPRVSLRLLEQAQKGELDGPDTVEADLKRAEKGLEQLGDPPPPEVREESRHLQANVEEAERHVNERKREADQAQAELEECRKRYLEVVDGALQDYRRRAIELGHRANIVVEIDLPRLENEDKLLDEAIIQASFGFDGKDPLPLGDSSFSGGQQVIAGIILLMAIAETDGQGFFLLDEPFAHLSLDRVDDVGRFLRSARAQFLLTAPTTLDRAQLDPASIVIVLQKKRPEDPYAPDPLVAVS